MFTKTPKSGHVNEVQFMDDLNALNSECINVSNCISSQKDIA